MTPRLTSLQNNNQTNPALHNNTEQELNSSGISANSFSRSFSTDSSCRSCSSSSDNECNASDSIRCCRCGSIQNKLDNEINDLIRLGKIHDQDSLDIDDIVKDIDEIQQCNSSSCIANRNNSNRVEQEGDFYDIFGGNLYLERLFVIKYFTLLRLWELASTFLLKESKFIKHIKSLTLQS